MTLAERNRRLGLIAAAFVAAMVGVGFASVPLYRLFCQATGFNGTTQRADAVPETTPVGRIVKVRFDGNVQPDLPWTFRPEQTVERAALGARKMAFFTATNLGSEPITGSAVFNVTPSQAGGYFTKIQCFCFTEQTLKPGETVRMPVIYYVDPKLADDARTSDIDEITLSYTFYRATKGVEKAGRPG
ncbi:cytochrome c oxidase assembly protein [Sphingomonas jatrophae]|uniref:Cytochrome c oxidase assembly protein CtaG n=1 Tax=Sphingomonas jatrophae TaxID=1166337 RepID=A0A1I6LEI5_9SPHN|nr:cytochrome c oxidase assembly protein [Sphingomonas jatrophae]SFS01853.1 cytochrome c oxidase assembly protein subunit 11 [Sphingomonas jatrophae]